jgi:crotonobetainyl-CoA:carnitine CoA-transferase CaiB-like acyl-CoA transferase
MRRPLDGITVVEAVGDCCLALRLSAALAGRVVADLGAEVVKIEPPTGDPLRRMPPMVGGTGALFAFLNAGKRSVVLPEEDGPTGLRRLVERTNALIADAGCERDLPSAAGRHLPEGSARVAVLISMLGGDAATQIPASEFTVLALGGVLNMIGEPDREPLRLGGHQAAYAAGLSAFTGLVAALCGAARATPEVVRVSLLEAAVWLNWKNVATVATGGEAPGRTGRAADWPVLRCADGWVALVYQDADWPAIRELANNDPRLADPAFATAAGRRSRAGEIASIVERYLANMTRVEIHDLALRRRLPVGPVSSPEDLAGDPHFVAREFLATIQAGDGHGIRLPRLPVLWSGAGFAPGRVPSLGDGARRVTT